MKKFIFKTSILSLFILTILISVNYWGDSANLFHIGYENKIAGIIFNNHHATNISNYDERILQEVLIKKLKTNPDILVLGSSRTMLINSTFFKNKRFINNSVSGASIEDLIAIFEIYKTKNILPKKIIIGIDPWFFNKNNGQKRWLSLKKYYYKFWNKGEAVKKEYLNNRVKQLFSFSYFQSSFSNLPNVIIGNNDPIPTDNIYNKTNTKLFDGSLSYSEKYRKVSNEEINNRAKNYVSGKIYSIENYKEIDAKLWKEFKYLCQDILKNNIELSFFLAPYHPLVYEKVKKDYPMVIKTENKVKEFANENNIKYWGSFNPLKIGIDNSGFYDGMHSKENTIKEIMKVRTHNNVYKSLGDW